MFFGDLFLDFSDGLGIDDAVPSPTSRDVGVAPLQLGTPAPQQAAARDPRFGFSGPTWRTMTSTDEDKKVDEPAKEST